MEGQRPQSSRETDRMVWCEHNHGTKSYQRLLESVPTPGNKTEMSSLQANKPRHCRRKQGSRTPGGSYSDRKKGPRSLWQGSRGWASLKVASGSPIQPR